MPAKAFFMLSPATAMPYGVGKVIPQLARGSSLPNGENDDRPAFPISFAFRRIFEAGASPLHAVDRSVDPFRASLSGS